MTSTFLADRRAALEERFFREIENAKLIRLKKERARHQVQAELQACGIEDEALVQTLAKLDVGVADLSALYLVPLVRVAWADGFVKDEERETILRSAREQGITDSSHSYHLLQAWLKIKPDDALYEAWEAYVMALLESMNDEEAERFSRRVLGLSQRIALIASGVFGFIAGAPSEKNALHSIERVLETHGRVRRKKR